MLKIIGLWLWEIIGACRTVRPIRPYNKEWSVENDWYRNFQPKKDVDYIVAIAEAKSRYKELVEVYNLIDTKAEWLFGVAFAATGALLTVLVSWNLNAWLTLLPAITLVAAMVMAMRCRMPEERTAPMTIRGLISAAENESNPDAVFAASSHCAVEGIKTVNNWKSQQLLNSAKLLIVAVCLFLIPLVGHLAEDRGTSSEAAYNRYESSQWIPVERSLLQIDRMEVSPVRNHRQTAEQSVGED